MNNIIVSFTSYPERIKYVSKILDCLVNQTILPDKIILHLSSEQFFDIENIPDLSGYKMYGFEISWHKENLGPHKKYFYTMQQYPDDIVITIDDDFYYKNTLIEELMVYHKKFPGAVIARRTHLVTWNQDGSIAPYEKWYFKCFKYLGEPRMDLVAIGCGGVLYPPHVFSEEVFRKEIFMQLIPYADDLWLKIMELYDDIPTVLAIKCQDDQEIEMLAGTGLYCNQNANGGNDSQLNKLLNMYNEKLKTNLVEKMISGKKLMSDNCENVKRNDAYKYINEFLKTVDKESEILIYGAGKVAGRIYKVFSDTGYKSKIKAFIVKSVEDNRKELGGIEVRSFRDFVGSSEKIIIGLWNTKQEEVYEDLIANGVEKERIIKISFFLNGLLEEVSKLNRWEGSAQYWENRYLENGNSGSGSYNHLAVFKAEIINQFVKENMVKLVIEWGCGDGNQLSLAKYPEYIGYDVSKTAISICKDKYKEDKRKKFAYCGDDDFENDIQGDLSLSLDVIYHLLEDEVYDTYMDRLFSSSKKYICIYSCDFEKKHARHVRCRKFTEYVDEKYKDWKLLKYVPNRYPYDENRPEDTSWSNFYFYIKNN